MYLSCLKQLIISGFHAMYAIKKKLSKQPSAHLVLVGGVGMAEVLRGVHPEVLGTHHRAGEEPSGQEGPPHPPPGRWRPAGGEGMDIAW